MEAAVMKILKQDKRICKSVLVSQVITSCSIRFVANEDEVQDVISSLHRREFVKEDGEEVTYGLVHRKV